MRVPVHENLAGRSETSVHLPVQSNISMSAPKSNAVVTTLPSPAPLHSSPEITKIGQNRADVGRKLVSCSVTPANNITSVEKDKNSGQIVSSNDAVRSPYAYHPGKTYRTRRVFKVIILGDAGVGKTCLSFRFCNGRFPAQTESTIGVDFRERSVVIDGELIRIQLWDTAGQERYRQSIVSHYYRNVNAVVFVYDVSNPSSFHSIKDWISECRKNSVSSTNTTPHILIGNKCDLTPENKVKTDVAQMFADQNDMALFETSALADAEADHVESIFMTLVHKLQQSKPMHVQSDEERARNEQKLLLKARDASKEDNDEGWCCG
ncbi:unnamed protein product [Thelazia callipaeda]|uniref:Ras-related protein Rab-33 n=1 Tax=Thelazia callipaeda TaxID=103827 RepID=A0A0N5D8W5_THECL|nr:unnamed protein product [Thelazia callipaeda]